MSEETNILPESEAAGSSYRYVIVGAGPAGVSVAENLRGSDAEGSILLVGAEAHPPYSRMAIPYLLTGRVEEEGTYLRQDKSHYRNLDIYYHQGVVVGIDCPEKEIRLDDGAVVQYEKLCLATGARPLNPPVPGLDQAGVHHCWTLDDAANIGDLAQKGANIVLIGAGFIGCIILEALALRGVNLTVVEQGDRMVPRMLDSVAGGMLERWCSDKGVTVLTSTAVVHVHDMGGGTLLGSA